jgi:hypothetical protein
MRHIADTELALYASGDLSAWRQAVAALHLGRCQGCRALAEAFRADRRKLREAADVMPDGVDWDSLSAEMTANIHLGLEAGQCVTPRGRRIPIFKPNVGWASQWLMAWRPAAVAAGLTVLLVGAWWLNVPGSGTQSLLRALRLTGGGGRGAVSNALVPGESAVVEATSSGIYVHENGSSLRIAQGDARPVAVSVSAQGSASARFVDDDTGQVTITSVYLQ